MANDFERRLKDMEEYQSILYSFINELRKDHMESHERMKLMEDSFKEFRESTERRFQQNEQLLHVIVEMNGNVLRLIDAVDHKIDGIDDRLKSAGI